MTLQDQIEASFGDGPEAPPLELTLAAGHGALRRRRIGVTLAAAAVLAVVGTGVSLAATGGSPDAVRDVQVATDGPSPSDATPYEFDRGELAAYDEGGTLVLANGVHVVERVDDPVELQPEGDSLGLVVEKDDVRHWLLLTTTGDSAQVVSSEPGNVADTFDQWLADMAAQVHRGMQKQRQHEAEMAEAQHLVEFGDGETLVVTNPDAEILDQMPTPVGEHLPPEAERSAVAMLRWHDETWFVLLRDYPGSALAIYPTPALLADDATSIEEYLAWRTGEQQ